MDSFCTEPYKQIHFDSRGNLGPCCQYIGERPYVTGIDEYLKSDWLKDLKLALSNNNRVDGCAFCWRQEESGAKSMRQKRNQYYNGRSLDDVEHIMITFGNQCNTACRICNSSRSSLIEKQYKEMSTKVSDENLLQLINKKHDWKKTKTWYKNIIEDIVNRCESIRKIEVSGGEPFINFHFDKLIDNLLASKKSLPGLNITTNGSFEESQIQRLKQFDHVHINFSIDGVGKDFYEYLRWPLLWDDVIKKIDILKKYPWITCEFVIVPHNLNILNLSETIIWLKDYTDYQERFKIGFSWLNGAQWYSIDNTPRWAREKAIKEIESTIFVDYTTDEVSQIEQLVNIIKNANTPRELNMLKSHIEMTDNYRKCNTWKIIGWNFDEI